MAELDTTAKSAVESGGFARADFIYLDIGTEPLRVTTFGQDVTFSGTGDSDLDGHTFVSFGGELIEISDVADTDTGSDTRAISLSGIVSIDNELVNAIGDKSLWQGRLCRTWFQLYDETGATKQGAIVADYTGYMSSVDFDGQPSGQTLTLSAEKYLSFFSQASNRSYLGQKDYDANDNSAAATIAAANGMRRDTGAAGAPVSDGGTVPSGTNPNVPSTGYGFTGSAGYVSYTPYPDNTSVEYNNPSYLGTSNA